MITLSEELTDSRGRPLHGGALASKREAEVHRREAELAEAERHLADREAAMATEAQARRDAAWMSVMGMGGPDRVLALARQHGDSHRAYRLLEAGGFPVADITGQQRDSAPRPAQSRSDFWSQFPDHDPDFVAGRRQLPDVAAEYDARQRERQAQHPSSVMWRTRDGTPVTDGGAAVIGASFGPSGAPAQRSVVSESVPPLGSEEV